MGISFRAHSSTAEPVPRPNPPESLGNELPRPTFHRNVGAFTDIPVRRATKCRCHVSCPDTRRRPGRTLPHTARSATAAAGFPPEAVALPQPFRNAEGAWPVPRRNARQKAASVAYPKCVRGKSAYARDGRSLACRLEELLGECGDGDGRGRARSTSPARVYLRRPVPPCTIFDAIHATFDPSTAKGCPVDSFPQTILVITAIPVRQCVEPFKPFGSTP